MTKEINTKLETYLKELEKFLEKILVADRSDILLELNGHIQDSLDKGDRSIDEILKGLGKPEQVANRYLIERGIKPVPPKRWGWLKWGCLSILAFFMIGFIALFFLVKSFLPILSIDEDRGYVNILGGLIEVDESKGTVKLGKGLFTINKENIDIKFDEDDVGIRTNATDKFVFSTKKIIGNGELKTVTRTIQPYQSVVVKGKIDTKVTIGDSADLKITGDANLLDYVETEVKEGTLYIEFKPMMSFQSKNKLIIITTAKDLHHIVNKGSGHFIGKGIHNESLNIKLMGSGPVSLEGKTSELSIKMFGSGNILAENLDAESVLVDIKGSGNANVNATKALTATVFGSGDIIYGGDPKTINRKVFGSGTIQKQ